MKGEHVFAAATADATVTVPRVYVQGETVIELGDMQLLAEPVRGFTLVVLFNQRSTLGLVRLRVHKARRAIEQAIDEGRYF